MTNRDPLDFACEKCGQPPGSPCIYDTLGMTPRQVGKQMDGRSHRIRLRRSQTANRKGLKPRDTHRWFGAVCVSCGTAFDRPEANQTCEGPANLRDVTPGEGSRSPTIQPTGAGLWCMACDRYVDDQHVHPAASAAVPDLPPAETKTERTNAALVDEYGAADRGWESCGARDRSRAESDRVVETTEAVAASSPLPAPPKGDLRDVFNLDRDALALISAALRKLRLSGELADSSLADALQEQLDRGLLGKIKSASPLPAAQTEEDGLVPDFTVWAVRRGKRFPMVIDSIFPDERRAELRAALLGHGEGWHVTKYQHLTALSPSQPSAPCATCQGRGWIMRSESHDLGNGIGAGGAWNEPCPSCSQPSARSEKAMSFSTSRSSRVEDDSACDAVGQPADQH